MTSTAMPMGRRRRLAIGEFFSAITTIMVKELRSRMRGRRAFIVLTVYLAILALIAYGVYTVVAPQASVQAGFGGFGQGGANASATIGRWIFILLSVFQLILISFIAPAFTAGQISLEREKQTLDLLISTPLRPGAIVIGKLLAALAFVVLMIVSAIPITAIVLMYGGASVEDIVRQQIVLLTTALGFGAIGLFFSALLKRTQAATVLTYCTVLALGIGTVMIFVFWTVLAMRDESDGFAQAQERRAPEQIMYLNPMVAMLDVLSATDPTGGLAIGLGQLRGNPGGFGEPVGVGVETVCQPAPQGDVCFERGAAVDIAQVDNGASPTDYWWPRFAVTFAGIAVLLTLAATRLIVPAGMRFAFRRPRLSHGLPPAPLADGVPGIEELPEPEP